MPRRPSSNVPAHVRRKLASQEYVAFIAAPRATASHASGDRAAPAIGPSPEFLDIVRRVMDFVARERAPVETLPFAATARGGIGVYAVPDGDGVRFGVVNPLRPSEEVPGILLRRAPDPQGSLFTLSGRGAADTMACNDLDAYGALRWAMLHMCGEIGSIVGPFRNRTSLSSYGTVFNQAFPEWQEYTGTTMEDEDEIGSAPTFQPGNR